MGNQVQYQKIVNYYKKFLQNPVFVSESWSNTLLIFRINQMINYFSSELLCACVWLLVDISSQKNIVSIFL